MSPHLGVKSGVLQNNINFIDYKNIVNKTRRIFFWEIIERDRNNYSSYKDFKDNWDPKTKIRAEIKEEIKADIRPLLIAKKAFSILIHSLNPKNHR